MAIANRALSSITIGLGVLANTAKDPAKGWLNGQSFPTALLAIAEAVNNNER